MSGLEPGTTNHLNPCWRSDVGDHVISISWSADGSLLAAAAVSGPIFVYQSTTGEIVAHLDGHGLGTTQIIWHPRDSKRLASSGQDGLVKIWNFKDHTPSCQQLPAGSSWVERIAWSPGGSFLASAAGRKLKLWDSQGNLKWDWPDHGSTISDIEWSPEGNRLASTSYGLLQVWKPEEQKPNPVFQWGGSLLRLAWSPDASFIATGHQDCSVHFWYVKTGQNLAMSGFEVKVRELSWDARSRFLATGGGEAPAIWDCSGRGPEGRTPLLLQKHNDLVSCLRYQARGPLLASGGLDGQVMVFQPVRSREPLDRLLLDSAITETVWAPSDRLLAVGTDSGKLEVLEWK